MYSKRTSIRPEDGVTEHHVQARVTEVAVVTHYVTREVDRASLTECVSQDLADATAAIEFEGQETLTGRLL